MKDKLDGYKDYSKTLNINELEEYLEEFTKKELIEIALYEHFSKKNKFKGVK